MLSSEQPPAGHALELELVALLVEDKEARHDRPWPRAHQLLGCGGSEQIGGGLVGKDRLPVLVHHGDRLGKVDEHRLQTLLDLANLGVQAGVVDRQRRSSRQLADKLEILARIGLAIAQPQHREGAERAPAREQRGDHRGVVVVLDHEPGVLRALCERAQQGARHRRQERGLATADDARDRMSTPGVELESRAQIFQLACRPRVGRDNRDVLDRAVLIAQIDHAEIGQCRHGELCHLTHRGRQIQGGGQHGAGLDEQIDRSPALPRAPRPRHALRLRCMLHRGQYHSPN